MENKDINLEHTKAEKFFNRLWDKSVSKAVSWFLIGICLFIIGGVCMVPAQELTSEVEDSPLLMPMVLTALTYLILSVRVSPYNQYVENQKSRYMTDITKYHPISKKAIWKLKTKVMIAFLGKVTVVGLVIQLIASGIAYQSISWINFAYIIGFIFVIPVGGELAFDLVAKKVGE